MPRYQQDYDDYDLDCDELRRQRRNRKRWVNNDDDDDLFEFEPEDDEVSESPNKP